MDLYLKIPASILISSVLCIVVSRHCKDLSLMLTLFTCAGALIAGIQFFKPVISFSQELTSLGKLNQEYVHILLKIIGIGMISQICGLVCSDAGNQSLAKALQIVTTVVILCISVPLLEELLSLIVSFLGEI